MQHKQNYEFQIFPHVKISDHIVVVWFHIFTSFKRSCFQSVIRVISSVSLSLIFIWWLSWVPVSTSITMSLSVNSYKHASMKKLSSFSDWWLLWHWNQIQIMRPRSCFGDCVYCENLQFWHHLACPPPGRPWPHFPAVPRRSPTPSRDRYPAALDTAQMWQAVKETAHRKFISTTAPLNKSQWHLKSVAVAEFFLFLLDVGGSNPWLTTQH